MLICIAVLSTRLAVRFLPNSSLANDYYLSFVVGFSGIALALRVRQRAGRCAMFAPYRAPSRIGSVFAC